MNNKIKIVATVAVATMLLSSCEGGGFREPLMGMPPPPPPNMPPPSIESTQENSDGFVNVDPPVGSENSEEGTE